MHVPEHIEATVIAALEPISLSVVSDMEERARLSIAISLKRIADAMTEPKSVVVKQPDELSFVVYCHADNANNTRVVGRFLARYYAEEFVIKTKPPNFYHYQIIDESSLR